MRKDVCEQGDARRPVEPQQRRTEAKVISNLLCRIYDVFDVNGCSEYDEQDLEGGEEGSVSEAFIEMIRRLRSAKKVTGYTPRGVWEEGCGWIKVVYTNRAEGHCQLIQT